MQCASTPQDVQLSLYVRAALVAQSRHLVVCGGPPPLQELPKQLAESGVQACQASSCTPTVHWTS